MRFHRLLCPALLTASLAFTPHARPQEPPRPAPPVGARSPDRAAPPDRRSPPPPKPDPQATQVLKSAINKLDIKKLGWVEATLWQQFDVQGLKVQVKGSYLAGPDYHLHVHLTVDLAGTLGTHDAVCDGTTLWRVWDVRRDKPIMDRQVDRLDWKKVAASLNRRQMPRQVQDAVLQSECFTGVTALLEALHKGMIVTGQSKARWHGHEVVKLTASWSPEMVKAAGGGNPPWLYPPDRYEIYLDRDTGWPYRLEGWGKVRLRTEDTLLVQIEFRDPKFHKDLASERIAREFTFRPGKDEVMDRTRETLDGIESFRKYVGQKK